MNISIKMIKYIQHVIRSSSPVTKSRKTPPSYHQEKKKKKVVQREQR